MDAFILSGVDKVLQFYGDPFDVVVITDTAYRFAAENDSEQPINVSAFIRPGVCQLHIIGFSKGDIQRLCNMSGDLQGCCALTHLVFNFVRISRSVVTSLTRAVRDGDVPLLEHLDFTGCTFEGNSCLVDLFEPAWPMLEHLNLNQCHLTEKDQSLPPRLENVAKLPKFQSVVLCWVRFELPTPWANLKSVWLHGLDISSYQIVLITVNTGNLPGLNELGLVMVEDASEKYTDYIKPIEHQVLTHLILHNVIRTMKHLYTISKSKCLTNLQKLDISHSSGFRGSLSILLCHSLLSLNSLVLKDCGLSWKDLQSLGEANVKGRIPEIKHLDISQNILFKNDLFKLFDLGCKWETLVKLNIEGTSLNCFSDLNVKVKSGCILGLEELCISEDVHRPDVTECTWPLLTDLQVYPNHCHDDEKLLSTVTEIITRNRFPVLENIFVSRKPQTDVSPVRRRMFERWSSSCKPELVEKSMRLISRALEKELEKKTSSEEAEEIKRKVILQEIPKIADSEKEGIFPSKREDFIQGFSNWPLLADRLDNSPAFKFLSIPIELLQYRFYDSFRYTLSDSFRVEFTGFS